MDEWQMDEYQATDDAKEIELEFSFCEHIIREQ